jgi:hypothetical protein
MPSQARGVGVCHFVFGPRGSTVSGGKQRAELFVQGDPRGWAEALCVRGQPREHFANRALTVRLGLVCLGHLPLLGETIIHNTHAHSAVVVADEVSRTT